MAEGLQVHLANKKKFFQQPKFLIFLLFLLVITSLATVVLINPQILAPFTGKVFPSPSPSPFSPLSKYGVRKFASEAEFKEYLQNKDSGSFGYGAFALPAFQNVPERAALDMTGSTEMKVSESADRISQTNVQVKGIDEPDIVKTDGKTIYYSNPVFRILSDPASAPVRAVPLPEAETSILPAPDRPFGEVAVIEAFPPQNLKKSAAIERQGEMLLAGTILVVFEGQKIYGYDVSNPSEPKEKWTVDLKDNSYLVTSRLFDGKIYFITQTHPDFSQPCPIIPLSISGKDLSIPCIDIYRPVVNVDVDSTYTVVALDPATGSTQNSISFVGSGGSTVVYMSPHSLYVTYTQQKSYAEIFPHFLQEKARDLIPQEVLQKIENVQRLDISDAAKTTELGVILQRYQSSLNSDDRVKFESEMQNRMQDYTKEHLRELTTTGVVKVSLDRFDVAATGVVPGSPLNQFSLDEHKDNLRIAVTLGGRIFGSSESANDVYVLDKDLKVLGKVMDLGLGERIYSVRFIDDKGYVVTFKQIDPFYVLDLSDPSNPQKKGELKLPGFSSYLHPLAQNLILGVGQEESKVKLSLFDVADTANPLEVDKYQLDEFWTEVSNNHHAFLLDDKYKVFFLPSGKGGYIFAYENGKISLKKTVSGVGVKRALFINDYLYIIGDEKIIVLDEKNWTTVKELNL